MDANRFDSLTPTQRDVLRLAADHSNSEIAQVLGLSRETVKTHLARAKIRLDGMHRSAASRALRQLEAAPAPLRPTHPPLGVNLEKGITSGPDGEAWSNQASGIEQIGPVPEAQSVCDPQEMYEVETPAAHAEPARTRFHARTLGHRLQLIATATLKVSVAILVMLSVAEGIQRILVSNPDVIPSR